MPRSEVVFALNSVQYKANTTMPVAAQTSDLNSSFTITKNTDGNKQHSMWFRIDFVSVFNSSRLLHSLT